MGGIWGRDAQWAALEGAWNAILKQPSKHKPPLSEFHMYECEHGLGEFEGYGRGDKDWLIGQLRGAILDAGLHGYSMAVCEPDWSELVTGDQLAAWGDAEPFFVTQCILRTLESAETESVESEVAFVFDNRPQRNKSNQLVFSIYQHYAEQVRPNPKPVGISFLSSAKTVPLQAADMFAWESYRHAQHWLVDGFKTKPRAHFLHFLVERAISGPVRHSRGDTETCGVRCAGLRSPGGHCQHGGLL